MLHLAHSYVSFQISLWWINHLFITRNEKDLGEKSLPEAHEKSGIEEGAPAAIY